MNPVNRRQTRQEQRTASGVKHGSWNATETRHLKHGEAQVQRRKQKEMAAHNGHLTRAEQKGMNRTAESHEQQYREGTSTRRVLADRRSDEG